ncbi:hypothetical protein [Paenibacillus gansuensis]|uniref:Uncharacterized protein n=1 Tax=Paenibacillus gansuensis TaxID=306542 RepID=A0ABW5P6Z7_9BACL
MTKWNLAQEILNRPSGVSRVLYISQLMKGYDAARMIADFRAQETIRAMTQHILDSHAVKNDGGAAVSEDYTA